jgi:hypothetical protein
LKLEKKEIGSLGDGKLMKTLCITLIPEDEEDERIIKKEGKRVYLG